MTVPIILSWSSGKDSAWALYQLQKMPDYEVVGLMTTLNEKNQRVNMHGIALSLLQKQIKALGQTLDIVTIPDPCSNEIYQQRMQIYIDSLLQRGIKHIAFGDLFLEDIRQYRETQLAGSGITPIFPLWGLDTKTLATTMIDSGLQAIISCIDSQQINIDCLGQEFDERLLSQLPSSADPCAENGEFHSFAYNGPMFNYPLEVHVGERVQRGQFHFIDLI